MDQDSRLSTHAGQPEEPRESVSMNDLMAEPDSSLNPNTEPDQQKPDHRIRKGVFYILASSLGFSIIPILATLGLSTNISTETLLFYRFFLAGVVFFAYSLVRQRPFLFQSRKNSLYLVTAAIIYSIQCILFFSAFQYIAPALGEVIFYIYPVFVAVLSVIFLKESMTKYKITGIFIALVGISVVLYAPGGGVHLKGVVLVILSALASSCYFIFNKKFTSDISAPVIMTYVCFTCSVLYLAYSLLSGEFTVPSQGKVWLYILLLALWSTSVGLFCLMQGLKLLSSGMASLLSLMEPIFTILLSYAIFGTALSPVQLMGTGMVIVAIYIYDRK